MSVIYINTGEQRSLISRSIDAMRAKGAPNSFAVLDTATNEVSTYSKPNNSPWVRQQTIDVPWRDPDEFDPLPEKTAKHITGLQAHHDTRVREMLTHLVSYYRPDIAEHLLFASIVNDMVASVPQHVDLLSELPDARARWELMLSVLVSAFDTAASRSKRKAKRAKAKK